MFIQVKKVRIEVLHSPPYSETPFAKRQKRRRNGQNKLVHQGEQTIINLSFSTDPYLEQT